MKTGLEVRNHVFKYHLCRDIWYSLTMPWNDHIMPLAVGANLSENGDKHIDFFNAFGFSRTIGTEFWLQSRATRRITLSPDANYCLWLMSAFASRRSPASETENWEDMIEFASKRCSTRAGIPRFSGGIPTDQWKFLFQCIKMAQNWVRPLGIHPNTLFACRSRQVWRSFVLSGRAYQRRNYFPTRRKNVRIGNIVDFRADPRRYCQKGFRPPAHKISDNRDYRLYTHSKWGRETGNRFCICLMKFVITWDDELLKFLSTESFPMFYPAKETGARMWIPSLLADGGEETCDLEIFSDVVKD
jgi:hypothetical protein